MHILEAVRVPASASLQILIDTFLVPLLRHFPATKLLFLERIQNEMLGLMSCRNSNCISLLCTGGSAHGPTVLERLLRHWLCLPLPHFLRIIIRCAG